MNYINFKKNFTQKTKLTILRTKNILYTNYENKLIYEISPNLNELKIQKIYTTKNHPTNLYLYKNDDILVYQISQIKSAKNKTQKKNFITKYSKT